MRSLKIVRLKPRNPLVAASLFLRAGRHRASAGRCRQRAALDLRRELGDIDRRQQSP
jgi:hypothetical protein